MEKWIVYAFVSMVFAGFTSVIAKLGLTGISGDLGLTIRTCFVFVFVLMFATVVVPATDLQGLTGRNCPGQVISHAPIGCLIADSCSKALGGKLPSLECSRALL